MAPQDQNQLVRDPRQDDDEEQRRREEQYKFYGGAYGGWRGYKQGEQPGKGVEPPEGLVPEFTPAPMPDIEHRAGMKIGGQVVPPGYRVGAEQLPIGRAAPFGSSEWWQARGEDLMRKTHPYPATGWKKFGRIMGDIGQTAGEAIVPNVMAGIPGTRLYNRLGLEEAIRRGGEAQTRESELALRGAQTQREQVQAAKDVWELGIPKAQGEPYTTPEGTFQMYMYPDGTQRAYPVGETPERMQPPAGLFPGGLTPGAGGGGAPPGGAARGTIPGVQAVTPPGQAPTVTPGEAGGGGGIPVAAAPQIAAAQTPQRGPIPQSMLPQGRMTKEQVEQTYLRLLAQDPATLTQNERDWMKAHEAEVTPVLPIGDKGKADYDARIRNALGPNVDPTPYLTDPRDTRQQAQDKFNSAKFFANEQLNRERPYVQEEIRDKRTQVYAINPGNGQLETTNKWTAEKDWGAAIRPVTPAIQAQDAEMIRQLRDAQLNQFRYMRAYQQVHHDISGLAATNMSNIINDQQIGVKLEAFGAGLDVSMVNKAVKDMSVASSWNALKDDEKRLLTGYLRAKMGVIAFNRALNKSSRMAEGLVMLEMKNLPLPWVGATVANEQNQAFQENIDSAGNGLPTNLPGSEHPARYRERLERMAREEDRRGGAPGPRPGERVKVWDPKTNRFKEQ
ncbi:MAG: hypothetical protein HRJ53_13405 [Acidobacteria bacterium Pan2503]|uniref:Uncharacterized protein n=1 Tax=Candidatus Acidiferrum panamense TaxID=2741543 RepID=A0A7V8NR38_9BACT|nr:hypothetical protein [Candidatus Acidoferrum panamensis]